MLLYNTLSQKKEQLSLPGERDLKLFVCGPTVYDRIHIGNARTYVAFDNFVRYLRAQRYQVYYLQNITDIEDKIIDRARTEQISPITLARQYERLYHRAEKRLGITSVSTYARATDYISMIVGQVKTLIAKGYAYYIEDDGYYFDLSKFPAYGKLSGRTTLQAEDSVSRVDESVKKRNKGDFCLWKSSPTTPLRQSPRRQAGSGNKRRIINGEPLWWTELGWGRPGWHIEDTAITEHHFGPQYDIHGGGVDIKFPHHEAEITQQESASGKTPMVKLWMHAGTLLVDGKKMSKSLGNFITLDDFLAHYSPNVFRYIVASHHYRSPLDYSATVAKQSVAALATITEFLAKIQWIALTAKEKLAAREEKLTALVNLEQQFFEAMNDDLNTPAALATIFSFINALQPTLFDLTPHDAESIQATLTSLLALFGLIIPIPRVPVRITALARKREKSRAHKDFATADELRTAIHTSGFILEDTPLGPFMMKRDN